MPTPAGNLIRTDNLDRNFYHYLLWRIAYIEDCTLRSTETVLIWCLRRFCVYGCKWIQSRYKRLSYISITYTIYLRVHSSRNGSFLFYHTNSFSISAINCTLTIPMPMNHHACSALTALDNLLSIYACSNLETYVIHYLTLEFKTSKEHWWDLTGALLSICWYNISAIGIEFVLNSVGSWLLVICSL